MHAFSNFNWFQVQSWEEGSTEDADNQMEPLGVEESLTGSAEKRDIKTVVEKMELTSMSITQANWQVNGITALSP